MFSAFIYHVQVKRLLHKFRFHYLISHYNVGVPSIPLNIHSAKNDLVLSLIIHVFD